MHCIGLRLTKERIRLREYVGSFSPKRKLAGALLVAVAQRNYRNPCLLQGVDVHGCDTSTSD